MNLAGSADQQELEMSGSGRYEAAELLEPVGDHRDLRERKGDGRGL